MAFFRLEGMVMMTVQNLADEIAEVEGCEHLVTPEFAPRAEFAGFGAYEAVAVSETGMAISALIDRIPQAITEYLTTRPESGWSMGGSDPPIRKALIKEWLDKTIAGPFNGDLASFVRKISHLGEKNVTFPGVQVPLPPQLVLALIAWLQGQILAAMGEVCDTATVSAAGAAWMNQFMLQLGIILEPSLTEPNAPMGKHESAEFHPYADCAGFGPREASILRRTGPLLGPAAGGVVTLAYDYLLSRPESTGYFQDASHLMQRKMTLKGWWSRTPTKPMDGNFHSYMSRVADAHVKDGGTNPHVVSRPI